MLSSKSARRSVQIFTCLNFFRQAQVLLSFHSDSDNAKKKKKEKRTMKNKIQLHWKILKINNKIKQNKHKYLGFTCCVEQYNLKHLKEQSLRTFQCPVFQCCSSNVTDFHPIQAWIFQTLLSQQLQHVVKRIDRLATWLYNWQRL